MGQVRGEGAPARSVRREAKRGACSVPELRAHVADVWAHTELAAVAATEAGGKREHQGFDWARLTRARPTLCCLPAAKIGHATCDPSSRIRTVLI